MVDNKNMNSNLDVFSTYRETNEKQHGDDIAFEECEIEGQIPLDLEGLVSRVGPDPQFALEPGMMAFDCEGRASSFRIKNGKLTYKSRFIRNQRYEAQDKAGRFLFPVSWNLDCDDPLAQGVSRTPSNTGVIPHKNMMLAMCEDGRPSALNPLTLETLEYNYDFDGTLPSETVSAHPKIDSHTGNLVAFGYEADGDKTNALAIFEYDLQGRLVWSAKVRMPYLAGVHDFVITENFVAFFLQPYIIDEQMLAKGGPRYTYHDNLPSYVGYLRRDGDGSDVKWHKTDARALFHFVSAFDDNQRLYIDGSFSEGNPIPFLPSHNGTPWDPVAAKSRFHRLSMDVSGPSPSNFNLELMYPDVGDMPRVDDRYHSVPYRYAYETLERENSKTPLDFSTYSRFDLQTKHVQYWRGGPGVTLGEPLFVPKHAHAGEAEGYILGVAVNHAEGGMANFMVFDAEHIDEGPLATVKLPRPITPQIHTWWTPEDKLAQFSSSQA